MHLAAKSGHTKITQFLHENSTNTQPCSKCKKGYKQQTRKRLV